MSYGLQISASGVAAAMYRQDVLANNLANINTVAFKPDIPSSRPRQDVRHEDGVFNLPSNELLERLGGGVLMNPNRINLSPGALRPTGNPLNIAIQSNGFLKLRNGDSSKTATLSRDGRLAVNTKGELVLSSSGMPVLDDSERPIVVAPGLPIKIDGNGTISQDGKPIASLGLVSVSNPEQLTKAGDGLMKAPAATVNQMPPEARNFQQNSLEDSGVNEIQAIMDMTSASSEVAAHVSLMQAHDKMMEKAINSIGRPI
jgi:flagellar basal body rod protein FlgG